MSELYRDSDVLLLPAVSEGFGIVQIEAGSHGMAVITTDRVGEFVRNGQNGYVVELGDYDGVVTRLRQMQEDRALLLRMGECSLQASREFSPQAYQDRLTGFIESMEDGEGGNHG
jgi:glycosyltransferase involved in cell wall biosynthesis